MKCINVDPGLKEAVVFNGAKNKKCWLSIGTPEAVTYLEKSKDDAYAVGHWGPYELEYFKMRRDKRGQWWAEPTFIKCRPKEMRRIKMGPSSKVTYSLIMKTAHALWRKENRPR